MRTTTREREAPTAANAFASVRSNPRALGSILTTIVLGHDFEVYTNMMIVGVYVVSGLQVENTAKVET